MKPKLAIVGGGISGVCLSYLLQDHYDITLFEKNKTLGGNNYSSLVEEQYAVPMGVVLFPRKKIFTQTRHFCKIFNLPLIRKRIPHVFNYNGVVQPVHDIKSIWYLLFGCQRDPMHLHPNTTLLDLITQRKLSKHHVYNILTPFAVLYLSMPYQDLLQLPAHIIFQWWKKYGLPLIDPLIFEGKIAKHFTNIICN
jgi:predicted NAD/FAD-binding protein